MMHPDDYAFFNARAMEDFGLCAYTCSERVGFFEEAAIEVHAVVPRLNYYFV
jgi:hypothetical protein